MSLLDASFGLFVGLALGLLGGGGSVLTVPLFVYGIGLGAREAIAASLGVVGVVSVVGAWGHARAGRVDVRTGLIFGALAMAGSFLGARIAILLAPDLQLALFAVVLSAAAFFMLRPRPGAEGVAETAPASRALVAAVALGVGTLTGLVGVGGGFMIVPALVLLLKVPMKQAVGTSLFVIALNAFAGFVGYAGRVAVPWALLTGFTGFAIGGILVGSWAVRFTRPDVLRRAFGLLLASVAIFIVLELSGVVPPVRPGGGVPT